MPELDTSDLRRLLDHAADTITPSPDAWAAIDARLDEARPPLALVDDGDDPPEVEVDLASATLAGRSWSRRRLALAVAAVLVLVAGVVGVLVSRARPDDDGIRATNDRFPMLRDVPDGLQLQGVDVTRGSAGSNASVSDAALVLTDAADDRGYIVTTGTRGSLGLAVGQPIETTVGDRPASLRVTDSQASLVWDDGAQSVSVVPFGPRFDEAELRRVAAGVRLGRDAALSVTLRATDVPDGLAVTFAGSAPDFAPSRQSYLSWGSQNPDLKQPVDSMLSLVGFVDSRVPAAGYAGLGAKRVTVAGRPGYLSAAPMDGAGSLVLTWSPADGLVAMLTATNIDNAALVRLAASVELVDESELRSSGSGWFSYAPNGDGEPTDRVLLAEGVVDGLGWRALTGVMKVDGSEDQRCLLLVVGGNMGSSCGSGPNDGSQGPLLQSTQVDERSLYLLVSTDDITKLEALDAKGSIVATGVAGTVAAGRRSHVWAVVVPSTLAEVRVRATGPGGAKVLDQVQEQQPPSGPGGPSGPSVTRFVPDQAALKAAPVLATGTIDGAPWTLRGALVPGVTAANGAAATTVPAPPAPCVALGMGARDVVGVVCDGMEQGPEPDMGMTAVLLVPTPKHAVLALVRPDVAAYEMTMDDGSVRTVATVEIAGSGGRRAVALVVDSEVHATSLTVVGTDGHRGAPISIDLTGTRQANVTFGSQGGTFGSGESAATTAVAAVPSLATTLPTTAP